VGIKNCQSELIPVKDVTVSFGQVTECGFK